MKHFQLVCVLFLFSAYCTAADYSWSDFMRVNIVPGKRHPESFDTAVVKFTGQQVDVDLVAAIHIGDKQYYEKLNELFKQYDVVLYELVAKQGVIPSKEKKSETMLSSLQGGVGEMLELEHQLNVIDYRAANFVHADLSPDEFAKRFAERGDFIQLVFNSFILGMKKAGDKNAEKEELKAMGRQIGALMFSSNRPKALKQVLAAELMRQSDDVQVMIGESSAIISDRNAAALKVLRKQIDEKRKGKFAIFYGGAHMPEFAQSLEKDFHLTRQNTVWLPAWNLQ